MAKNYKPGEIALCQGSTASWGRAESTPARSAPS